MNEGSRLSLGCRIESPSAPPSYVYWYRDGDVVNYSNKEGVSIRCVFHAQKENLYGEPYLPPSRQLLVLLVAVQHGMVGPDLHHPPTPRHVATSSRKFSIA